MHHPGIVISAARRGGIVAGVVVAVAAVLALGSAPAAVADGFVMTLSPATQTVEYGTNWSLTGSQPAATAICGSCSPGTLTITLGSVAHTIPGFLAYFPGGPGSYPGEPQQLSFGDYTLMPDTIVGAGTHTISATYLAEPGDVMFSSAPVTVIVTPTAVSTQTTIAVDPNNSANAIITSQLSGHYIEQLPNCQCEGQNGYLLPAGTWNLTVTNSQGKTVFTKQSVQSADGLPSFVNYWPSVPAGETFSAETTFTVADAEKANFTTTSQKFSWTSKKRTGEQTTISPGGTPKPIVAKPASFAPPIVVYWAALLVALILIALDVILLVNNRRSARTSGEDRARAR